MRSILELLILHCQTEQVRGAQNIRQGGHPCQVVPSHIMFLLLELESGTGVLQGMWACYLGEILAISSSLGL